MTSTKTEVEPFFPRLWATKKASRFVRTATLVWMMWLTSNVFSWAMTFASTSEENMIHVAAVVGALLTPLGLLHAAIFKFYTSPYERG